MSSRRSAVADIIPFSWVDGPGNRFVIFFQGCNFDCVMCHNPQTIPLSSAHATSMDVAALVERIREAMPYITGVTVSGGEATLHWEFLVALFTAIRADAQLRALSILVDSNGHADRGIWDALLPLIDGAMIDLKVIDPQLHREFTGQPIDLVLATIEYLAPLGKLHEVRLLLAPGHNDSDELLVRTADYLRGVDPSLRIRINVFRTHGVRKPASAWAEATEEQIARWRTFFPLPTH